MNEYSFKFLQSIVTVTGTAYFCLDTTNLKCLHYHSNLPWKFASTEDEILHESGGFLKSIFPDDKVSLLSFIDSIPENISTSYDFRVLDNKSEFHWVRFLFQKNYNELGKFCEGMLFDISSEKEEIAKLKHQTDDVQDILRSGFDAFYFLTPYFDKSNAIIDFRVQEINDVAIRQLGCSREEIVGQLICEVFPINLKNGFFEKYKEAFLHQKSIQQEFQISDDYVAPGWYEQQIVPLNKGIAIFNRTLTPWKKAEAELRESLWYIESINHSIPGIISIINTETGDFVYINRGIKKILGYTSWMTIDNGINFIWNLVHPDDKEKAMKEYADAVRYIESDLLDSEKLIISEYRVMASSGQWKFLRNFITKFRNNEKKKLMLSIAIDTTDEQNTKDSLSQREIDLETLLSNMPDMVARFDLDFNCLYINRAVSKILDTSEAELLKKNLIDFPFSPRILGHLIEAFQIVKTTNEKYEFIIEFEFKEEIKYFQTRVIPEQDIHNLIFNIIMISWDVTEIKKAEKQLYNSIFYDPLTSLTNRKFFLDKLEETIGGKSRLKNFAIMFIDVDRFQELNDSLGHIVADVLLKIVSKMILQILPKDVTFSRLGGDEFACLIPGEPYSIKTYLASLALEIMNQFSEPITIEENEIYTSVSIGIAIYPSDGSDGLTLLKNADKAMYHGKQKEYNSFTFYTSAMGDDLVRKRKITQLLRKSIETEEFELYYQPKVDIIQRKVLGAEALIRWKNPDYRSPDVFIPIAEESGMIVPLGEWIIQRAIKDLSRLKRSGHSDLTIAVNLSARQFQVPKVPKLIFDLLTMNGIKPECFEVEITEGVAMKNINQSEIILREISSGGIKISIDDFGTGYSSLSYLKKFPIDYLKIDRVFIKDIPEDKESCAIVSAVISMAHDLGLSVIAEGLETKQQLDFLLSRNCDIGQGFLFSRPLPLSEFQDFLTNFTWGYE